MGILGLACVLTRDGRILKLNLVCPKKGFRHSSIMHGCVAEIILRDHLTPEGGALPPFTQMTNVQWMAEMDTVALVCECSLGQIILYAIFLSIANKWFVLRFLIIEFEWMNWIKTWMLSFVLLYHKLIIFQHGVQRESSVQVSGEGGCDQRATSTRGRGVKDKSRKIPAECCGFSF